MSNMKILTLFLLILTVLIIYIRRSYRKTLKTKPHHYSCMCEYFKDHNGMGYCTKHNKHFF